MLDTNKSFKSPIVSAEEFESLVFSEKDYCNYIDEAHGLRVGKGRTSTLVKYFGWTESKNDSFFSTYEFR